MRLFIDFLVSKEFSSEGRQTGCGGHRPDASRRGLDLQRAVWELCRHESHHLQVTGLVATTVRLLLTNK